MSTTNPGEGEQPGGRARDAAVPPASVSWLAALARREAVALAVFAVGAAFAWYGVALNRSPGETGQAAMTLLDLGFIGNPYLLPTGPTAHVSPLLAGVLSLVYAVFGPNTAAARLALGVMAAGLYALSVAVSLRLCDACRPGGRARPIAAGVFVLMPFFLFWSVVYNRQWDQPFSALILVCGWFVFERSRATARPARAEAMLAALTGIGTLFSPALLPPLLLSLGGMIRRRAPRRRPRAVLLAGIVVAAFLLPWGLRNQAVLGQFILTRSNGPLELATGNGPGTDGASGSGDTAFLHPHDSPGAARAVVQLGELGYMQAMRARALGWIAAHPWRFLVVTLRRILLTWLPTPEMVPWHPLVGATLAWGAVLTFGVLRLGALGAAVALRERPLAGLTYAVLPLAPYFVTHVNIRYLYLVYFTSVVLIAVVLDRIGGGPAHPRGAPRS